MEDNEKNENALFMIEKNSEGVSMKIEGSKVELLSAVTYVASEHDGIESLLIEIAGLVIARNPKLLENFYDYLVKATLAFSLSEHKHEDNRQTC